jgi:hypothetical protein
MKKFGVLLMLAAAGLLGGVGCNGRGESTITGGYGSSMISGEVHLSGVSNTNPEGVQVSVRGTGMTAILGADGQFAFANIPEGAVLDFSRASDSIDASLALEVTSGFVTVELQQAKSVASTNRSPVAYRAAARRCTSSKA